jgi:competence protein ComEC
MQSPLVNALLYGKMEGVPSETIFLFARTGLIHVFSASGFHLGVALLISKLLSKFARVFHHPRAPALATFSFAIFFMVYFGCQTAWSSPMVRAFTYSALLSAASLLEIRASKLRLFALSLLAAAIFGAGSWLSYALSALGMAGILFVRPRNTFTLLLAPWACTLPLALWHFQLFSITAPLWNLTVGAGLGLSVLPPAILALLLKSAHLPDEWAYGLAEMALEFWVQILERGDVAIGGAYWVEPKLFLCVGGLLLLGWWWKTRGKNRAAAVRELNRAAAVRGSSRAAAVCAAMAAALGAIFPAPYLAALDVGQGDSIYMRLANGTSLLVDQGPPAFRSGQAPAARSLEALAIGPIDHLLFSHLDRDHTGGAPSVLERHPVGQAWMREEHLSDKRAIPLLASLERAEVPVHFLGSPLPSGLKCWLPPPIDSNDSSSLCRAELSGRKSIWLTGDAGFASEEWLMSKISMEPANFLKLGHHGSRFSSGEDFLGASGATIALVSVGRKNRYGHPTAEALDRAAHVGLSVQRTDQEGSLAFRRIYW